MGSWAPKTEPPPGQRVKCVLVVDDSAIVRDVIIEDLVEMDIEVLQASSGAEAITMAREEHPDLITLDIEMPGINGYEVCEDLMMDASTMRIPVVVISHRPEAQEALSSIAAGAQYYLGKPFPEGAVRAIVQDINDAYAARGQRVVFCKDDSRAIRSMLRDLMNGEGFQVRQFSPDHDVRKMLTTHRADVLLLGFDDDHREALSLLRWIRDRPELATLPVIALARSGSRRDLQVAFQNGANDYIRMPFFAEELVARVANQLHLKELEGRLRREATIDPLSHLFNRREVMRLFDVERSRALRDGAPLGCLLFDVDEFKNINDHGGHAVGDAVLRELSEVLRSHLRKTDVPGRLGGDEFVALLPGASLPLIEAMGERIRLVLADRQIGSETLEARFTVSVGGASWSAEQLAAFADWDTFIEPADRALYLAKSEGRNQTRVTDAAQ